MSSKIVICQWKLLSSILMNFFIYLNIFFLKKVSGIVYFDFEISKILFNLVAFPPLDACSYMGIDSGASPVSVNILFKIFYRFLLV